MQDKICDICKRRPAEYTVTAFEKGLEKTYEVCELDYVRLRRRDQLETSKPLSKYFNEADPLLDISVLVPEGETFEPDNEFREVAVEAKDYFELEEFFSKDTREVLLDSVDIARAFGWDVAKSEHLLLALLDLPKIREVLEERKVDVDELIEFIEQEGPKSESFVMGSELEFEEHDREQHISQEVHEVLEESLRISQDYKDDYIYPRHLLLALYPADTLASYILRKFNVSESDLMDAFGY